MPPVPAIRGSQVVRALEKAGFVVGRVNGSHHIMHHPMAGGRQSRFTLAVISARARCGAS
jgi:predicted RNA binding protein YcfA (HicA-like mRNA interferase family)